MTAIDARTRIAGIIGWPVEHSLSPAMHNAAFEALGLNWAYAAFPVHPDRVGEAVRGLAAAGCAGLNVTIPHKQAVIGLLLVHLERRRTRSAPRTPSCPTARAAFAPTTPTPPASCGPSTSRRPSIWPAATPW